MLLVSLQRRRKVLAATEEDMFTTTLPRKNGYPGEVNVSGTAMRVVTVSW
jgi:hypothetical protein